MSLNTNCGAGTTLSANFYLRKFYTSNMDARTSSKRSSIKNSELSFADSAALRRAVKKLGSFSYDDSQDDNLRNGVLAYISTYNNTLSSLSDSDDASLQRSMKQLKSLTKEYASNLDKIGITVNTDGTLTSRETLFKSASLSKFEKLFSKDADYMQRVSAYGKRIERRSEALVFEENQNLFRQNGTANSTANKSVSASDMPSDSTAAAEIVAASLGLNAIRTGVGQNVDILL